MSLPTSYDEFDLAAYMLASTKSVSGVVGICDDDFQEAINDTLVAYGVTDLADATDIAKLRALAKLEAWRCVIAYLLVAVDFSADGGSYKNSQMLAGAERALARAENDAALAGYASTFSVEMGTLTRPSDPYASGCLTEELERN